MRNTAIALLIVLAVGGAAAAAVYLNDKPEQPAAAALEDGSTHFDQSADVFERVLALEVALSEEREARQLLESEMFRLIEEVDQMRPKSVRDQTTADNTTEPVQISESVSIAQFRTMGQRTEANRIQALVGAGFTEDRAEWIIKRESALRMEALEAAYEARRDREVYGRMGFANSSESMLRSEIGENEYEMYLKANNRPTSILINSVFETSPAQAAGLKPGDRIVRYGGNRVFSTWDLNREVVEGESGGSVVIDIVRDGTPMQVVLPRGPLGISGGRG